MIPPKKQFVKYYRKKSRKRTVIVNFWLFSVGENVVYKTNAVCNVKADDSAVFYKQIDKKVKQ